MNDIGQKLRIIRMKRGLTMKQLAEKSGVSANTIQSWEVGKYAPRFDSIELVLAVFGMELCIRERKTEENNGGESNE